MFTGLIECQGVITRVERVPGGIRLEVYAPEFGRDMSIGDSIAIDGVCLTVVKFIRGAFLSDVSGETLDRTTLGRLQQGSPVNLERALRLSDRFGGHFVTGHVDAIGQIAQRRAAGNSTVYLFAAPDSVMDGIVEKGSVAVDGISLTVSGVTHDGFSAAVVPHTEEVTTLAKKAIGAQVNIETDMLGKYVVRRLETYIGTAEDTSAPRRGGRLGDMLRDLTEGR